MGGGVLKDFKRGPSASAERPSPESSSRGCFPGSLGHRGGRACDVRLSSAALWPEPAALPSVTSLVPGHSASVEPGSLGNGPPGPGP